MILNDVQGLWVGGRSNLFELYQVLVQTIDRKGKGEFLEWLVKETDFFRAPASANNHGNYESGLVEHSLQVYFNLVSLVGLSGITISKETLVIAALAHDICKANFYLATTRNIKINGVWVQEPYFSIEDKFPIGHGEKSVIILQKFIELTDEEIMAIRWHMGGFDDSARSYAGGLALSKALQCYPLITLLHCADLISCLPEMERQSDSIK